MDGEKLVTTTIEGVDRLMVESSDVSSATLRKRTPSSNSTLSKSNSKKNEQVHKLFKSLPVDSEYVTDYSCALQKDILLHGRMYITTEHVCFYANIFGFITSLVIPMTEMTMIQKRMTLIIPNAISISTGENCYFFTSFLQRDQAFLKITDLKEQSSCSNSSSVDDTSSATVPCNNSTGRGEDTDSVSLNSQAKSENQESAPAYIDDTNFQNSLDQKPTRRRRHHQHDNTLDSHSPHKKAESSETVPHTWLITVLAIVLIFTLMWSWFILLRVYWTIGNIGNKYPYATKVTGHGLFSKG